MSIDPFPEHVTARKLCDRNRTINSSIPLGKLLRLSEYLVDTQAQVEVCLSFDRDESGTCCLSGNLTAAVRLQCQRCLEPVTVSLDATLAIKLAQSEPEARKIADQSANTLDKLDVVICKEGELNLLSVIEDELIMSLPIVAAHASDQCNTAFNALHAKTQRQEETMLRSNIKGLDVLQKLKQELAGASTPGDGSNKRNKNK